MNTFWNKHSQIRGWNLSFLAFPFISLLMPIVFIFMPNKFWNSQAGKGHCQAKIHIHFFFMLLLFLRKRSAKNDFLITPIHCDNLFLFSDLQQRSLVCGGKKDDGNVCIKTRREKKLFFCWKQKKRIWLSSADCLLFFFSRFSLICGLLKISNRFATLQI